MIVAIASLQRAIAAIALLQEAIAHSRQAEGVTLHWRCMLGGLSPLVNHQRKDAKHEEEGCEDIASKGLQNENCQC